MSRLLEQIHAAVSEEVTARAQRLWEVSGTLHRHPELAYEEHRAAALLTSELEQDGFTVERGVAGLDTAFVARSGTGSGPRAALLLEYDALPGLGHACGHNLIAAAGLGAALAVRAALERHCGGPVGDVLAVGTPAEERGGGKVALTAAGVFDGVDAALMFHPGVHNWAWAPLTAQTQVRVGFHGRAAHPTGNPTEGIDALAALIQLFNSTAVIGRRLPVGSHLQGIVTAGGEATNVVPDYAEGLFGLRGATTADLEHLVDDLRTCVAGTAHATGTTADVSRVGTGYEHFRGNKTLADRLAKHLGRIGITVGEPAPGVYLGSSDIGDVSGRVPSAHPFVAIAGEDASDHTPDFAEAAAGPRGRRAMLVSAEALGCTAADVLLDSTFAKSAWEELRRETRTP